MSQGLPLWPYPPHTNTPTPTCRGSTLRHYPPLHQFSHAVIAPLRRPGPDRVARRTGPNPHHTPPPPTGLLLRRQSIRHESLVGWPGPTPSLEGCRDPWPRPPRGVHGSVNASHRRRSPLGSSLVGLRRIEPEACAIRLPAYHRPCHVLSLSLSLSPCSSRPLSSFL